MSRIPFLDLCASAAQSAREVETALLRVARSGLFLRGPETASFEHAWAQACSARGAVAVSSGTDALRLALLGAGIASGDEVVVPAFGSPYSALAVCGAGAVPVFAEIDPSTWTITADSVAEAIGPRTKAVVAVHLYGRRADLAALARVTEQHRLPLIEDAAQAHGLRGPPRGLAQVYSFYPTKNLGALGDAGCVVSNDEALLERVRLLREGGDEKALAGRVSSGSARIDELQAAVLLAKLPFLSAWNRRRVAIAERYTQALSAHPTIRLPREAPAGDHVFHLFVIEHPDRAPFIERLAEDGIEVRVHYPLVLHTQPLFRRATERRSLPHAERAAERVLSLPLHPGLGDDEVARVIDAVLRAA
jgi:dTDP-4-amino-4,6-dideoxygalactose transaminase